jgi:hypothetical protein
MSSVWVSLLFSVGAATWIYTKFQRSSGNNTKQSVTAACICGVLVFIIFLYLLNMITK